MGGLLGGLLSKIYGKSAVLGKSTSCKWVYLSPSEINKKHQKHR